MSTWHGLTDEQVLATWDLQPWREEIVRGLVRVAICDWMPNGERARALSLLNEGIIAGVLPRSMDYPGFAGRTMFAMLATTSSPSWWRRRGIHRLTRQLEACEHMLRIAANFIPREYVAPARQPPALDTLLS